MLIAPPRRSEQAPAERHAAAPGLKPSGTLAGYDHAAPTALHSRASRAFPVWWEVLPRSLSLARRPGGSRGCFIVSPTWELPCGIPAVHDSAHFVAPVKAAERVERPLAAGDVDARAARERGDQAVARDAPQVHRPSM